MEYLQYLIKGLGLEYHMTVLNLVINGIPSIQNFYKTKLGKCLGFKPCYKWNTFNTSHITISPNSIIM